MFGSLLKKIYTYGIVVSTWVLAVSFFTPATAQDRFPALEQKLSELSKTTTPGLKEKVSLSLSDIPIGEFVRSLAVANNLNISVDPALDVKVVVNFSNEAVSNIILFLCRQYNLDIEFVGSIMSVKKYIPPIAAPVKPEIKELSISYNASRDALTMDLKKDTLDQVAKKITQLSKKNVVLASGTGGLIVSVYVQDMTIENALDRLALANDLRITKTDENDFVIERKTAESSATGSKKGSKGKGNTVDPDGLNIQMLTPDSLGNKRFTVDAINVPLNDAIKAVSKEAGISYILFSEIKGNTNANIINATFDDFLKLVLQGSDYTFKKENHIYLIGDRNLEGLRVTKTVQLQYRSADTILFVIPADLKKGVDIKSFPEQNSLILSGAYERISEIESFIRQIDKLVPMILIEVIVVDVNKTHVVSTGLTAGMSDSVKSGGTIYPGVNYTLGSGTINDLLELLSGNGIFNIGKVTPNFYVNLKALEDQRNINIRSTPQLATLNSHSATMKVGQTQYYLIETTNYVGSQVPTAVVTKQYKEAKADLSITIRPIVSGNDQVTLDIEVELSNFTGTPPANAPPATATRQFKSLVRVKNQDMILLGGLDEQEISDNGSGLPILSRIPVLKWIFSSRTKSRRNSKLSVFIKPTIIY